MELESTFSDNSGLIKKEYKEASKSLEDLKDSLKK